MAAPSTSRRPALLLGLGLVLGLSSSMAFVPRAPPPFSPTTPSLAGGAAAAASAAASATPSILRAWQRPALPQPSLVVRAASSSRSNDDDGDDEAEAVADASLLPEGLPTDRPLTSVEKRRIARASKTDQARKLSKNQRLLDDFLGKRMGQGNVFYGEALADLDDDAYAQKVEAQSKNDKDERLEVRPLRDNPVLVVGATGGTGQWVVSDLLSKGFSVRAFVRNLDKAEDLFGWDGANLDVFEGDVKDAEALREASRGALAVVYCAGSREILGGNSFEQVDGVGVENAVQAARESGGGPGARPSVRKFILLSSIGVSKPDEYGFFGKLLGDPLKAKARGERAVRQSGLESYCIVRAAGLRDGDGVKRRIEVGQGDRFGRSGVSRLDVASMLVQALVQDVNNVTFEVRNTEEVEDQSRLDAILGTSDQRQIVEYFLREDEREEERWAAQLGALVPDDPGAMR
jgi:uncharacterized protein YbjT (DUF2867 family)